MSFVLYALLKSAAGLRSVEELKDRVEVAFAGGRDFAVGWEAIPFSEGKVLRLSWGDWSVNLRFVDGPQAQENLQEIRRRLPGETSQRLADCRRYLHVFFGDDPERMHTSQVVDLMKFLEELEDVLVFDPRKSAVLQG